MSSASAMNTAVAGLHAQSKALSYISSNLANSSTPGYKNTNAGFSTLVTGTSTDSSSTSVRASAVQYVTSQGNIVDSDVSTNMAISGNGFFCVTYGVNGSETFYTRNGSFGVNEDGYLTYGNYYLQGWPTDSSGNITNNNTTSVDALEAINVNKYANTASATTSVSLNANLPADAAVGKTYDVDTMVYDSLGGSHTVTMSWEKTAVGTWSLSFSNAVASTGTSTTTEGTTTSGGPYTVTFDGNGAISTLTDSSGATVDPAALSISITGWTDGATNSSVSFDFSNVTQISSQTSDTSTTDPTITVRSLNYDGNEYGELENISIEDDGTVTANYSNNQSIAIYKVALATFSNPNGLNAKSNGVYEMTMSSGNYTLHTSSTGGAGEISGSSLEESTVDTSSEFSKMIVAQQAYSAASQVISTCNEMYDSLLQAVR